MIKYCMKILFICTAGLALAISLGALLFILMAGQNLPAAVAIAAIGFAALMYFVGKKLPLPMPKEAVFRFFPFFLPLEIICISLLYEMLRTGNPLALDGTGHIANLNLHLIIGIGFVVSAIFITLGARSAVSEDIRWKRFWILPSIVVFSILLVFGLDAYRATYIFRTGGGTERVSEELSLYRYMPFLADNSLIKAGFTPSLMIDSNYPRLDGATAAYPVYAAMAETLYRGLDDKTVRDFVGCNRTDGAFERLIGGEADIIFGVQPSAGQLADAEASGIQLIPIKVAQEAFVFFVNKVNPITNLSAAQIQRIYTKEITDWSELGSKRGAIIAYQRPDGSGSQTIMEQFVMRGTKMSAPILEEVSALMGDIIGQVASYRSYGGAIGYSFRYFATVMNPGDQLRLLSVEGIEPTRENIQSGTYPYTVDVYAYTTAAAMEKPHVRELLEWIVSDEGQRLIELCGYTSR